MEESASSDQYDSLLGGQIKLPASFNVRDFVSARIQEIKALTEVIETPSNAIAEMRSFPKHMKRRAMSHNIKRIPKRLRELHAALREKSNTREGPSKVPRRKYRRRPKELLKEYNRRQRDNVWLETHIWHAKRFKMVSKWGYKVPLKPNDKSYRACYRATANHCLLQDISYYNCIELSGLETSLISGLSKHTNPEAGLTFAARKTISGSREGSVCFYRADKYPFGAIGEIRFIWKPISNDNPSPRTIWLWYHPDCHEEVLGELINTFSLTKIDCEETMDCQIADNENDVEMKKLELRNVPFVRTPKYQDSKGINLTILKDTLNRFRLIGPLSQAVLAQCLVPVDWNKRLNKNEDWTHDYYLGEKQNTKFAGDAQNNIWSVIKQYHSPAQLTPGCVLPLTIIDPRFIMPSSRKKATDTTGSEQPPSLDLNQSTAHLDSPLWLHSIRDKVTKSKLSTEQLNRMRSDKLVPGIEIEWSENCQKEDLPCLPIILIQIPGSQESNKRIGYGSGWDIISPCGYGMPLWLSFVLSGARVGGLRECEAFSRELGRHQCYLEIDTPAGEAEENEKRKEATDKFFRLPPAKRCNYIKLNNPTPFYSPWSVLIKDWQGTEEFYVLRNKKMLDLLNRVVTKSSIKEVVNLNEVHPGALVPVRIDLIGKGNLTANAHICLIKEKDLQIPPKEPHKEDNYQLERNNMRQKHQKLLRKLGKKRHAARTAVREESKEDKDFKQIIIENSSETFVKDYNEKMKSLWLPQCSTIKDICTRTIIGFVNNGDFCFTEANSSGVGYVTLVGLKEYLNTRISEKNIILIRCTNTDQYRLAKIYVIC